MQLRPKRLKRSLLYLSLVFYLVPLMDTYVLPSYSKPVTIESYPKNHSQRYAEIYIIQLSNGKQLNVQKNTADLLSPGDCCMMQYSSFGKSLSLKFQKGGTSYSVKTGMLYLFNVRILLYSLTCLTVLALVLLYTKVFDRYSGSDIGPYVIFLFMTFFLLSYITHD